MLGDSALLAQLAENALSLVKKRFTWEHISHELEQHYQQLLHPDQGTNLTR